MVRVSLSGSAWLEEVPGEDFTLRAPPGSTAWYVDTHHDLESLDCRDGLDGFRIIPGKTFEVRPGGGFRDGATLHLLTPLSVLQFSEEEHDWFYLGLGQAPKSIDRRKTIWERLDDE